MQIELENCELVCDTADLSREQFAMLRRNYLGASDASVYLGLLTKFDKNALTLIDSKCIPYYTEEEAAIGEKPAVRAGNILEPYTLSEAGKQLGCTVLKPTDMYAIKEYPFLAVNFDGYIADGEYEGYPVEAKFTSTYGDKYYDYKKAYRDLPFLGGNNVSDPSYYCDQAGKHYGIPPYYYAQIQQQMLATETPFGFLASIREKDWKVYLYKIYASKFAQNAIIIEGGKVWNRIEKRREKENFYPQFEEYVRNLCSTTVVSDATRDFWTSQESSEI